MTTTAQSPATTDPPAPVRPNYMAGFDGIASAAFPGPALAVFSEPVKEDEVEIRFDGIPFLPGVWYRRQLTRAVGAGAWALAPRGPSRSMGNAKTYHGALYILGRYVSEAVGECECHQGSKMTEASAFEGAKTDCLSRCCKDLGMAAELWDPYWRERFLAKWGRWEMKGEAGKQRKVWERRDKAADAALPEHRDSGPRVAPPKAAEPAPAKAVAVPAAVPPKEITSDEVRAAAGSCGRETKWCNEQFRTLFAVRKSIDELTQQQRADAIRLFGAAKVGPDEFDKVLAELMSGWAAR